MLTNEQLLEIFNAEKKKAESKVVRRPRRARRPDRAPVINTNLPKEYQELQQSSINARERNDCTVKALSIATGMPYDEAHSLCAAHGRMPRKGMQRNAITGLIAAELLRRGKKLDRKTVSEMKERCHNALNKSLKKHLTLNQMAQTPSIFKGKWLVCVRRHILVVEDGKALDWTVDSARRVEEMWQIIG